uniref:Uncharacterized protein n=1 Tax=viral metagenome TaxID=1070528 RepID=A0A6H1ZDN8_9ZZZZ
MPKTYAQPAKERVMCIRNKVMIPEDKIICLIKKYRALSEMRWGSAGDYARVPPIKSMKGGKPNENKK